MGLSETEEMTGSKSGCSCFAMIRSIRTRVPASDSESFMLRHDQIDKELSKVMYVNIDNVRVTDGVEFEVYENNDMVLCGSLERWKVFGSMEMCGDWITLQEQVELRGEIEV
ncbi:hypothetical protein ACFX12_018604 [Malus domestica]